MNLFHNRSPQFAHHVLSARLLSTQFVLLDVGVQGGIHPRWDGLGSLLRVYGFDALEEVIEPLRARKLDRHTYYAVAIGAIDDERDFFVAKDLTASSLSPRERAASTPQRKVRGRRLDTLLAEGLIERPDFIKIDVEGHEPEVLAGAGNYILDNLVGVEAETSFDRSPDLPRGHLTALIETLAPHGLVLRDIAISRYARPALLARARQLGVGFPAAHGCPGTLNALFCREAPCTQDEVIKLAIVLESYGLMDVGYDALSSAMPDLADLMIQKSNPWNTARHETLRQAFKALGQSFGDVAAAALRSAETRSLHRTYLKFSRRSW